jgi:hypothetical protein
MRKQISLALISAAIAALGEFVFLRMQISRFRSQIF